MPITAGLYCVFIHLVATCRFWLGGVSAMPVLVMPMSQMYVKCYALI